MPRVKDAKPQDQPLLPALAEVETDTTPAPTASNGRPKKAKANGYEPPNLAKAIRLPVPDFSDPNRKKTCLEVDFPIAQINALSKLEGNAGKPIYQMSKWWARRRSSVFRAMLIAAATEAPDNPEQAAKRVWDHYYCNHQKARSFKGLKVLDPFMGGGTTLVEGSRLGFELTGVDLNPVAWFVTKNELACSDPQQVAAFFQQIEAEVKPQIQPFYTTTCPRGHRGRWIDTRKLEPDGTVPSSAVMPDGFDPIELAPEERRPYRWDGPEVIYTFWAKHGPCMGSQGQPCGHRTPIFRTPVIAEKKLTAHHIPIDCPHCGHQFHAELGETRMAPGAERVVVEGETSFTEMSQAFALKLNDYGKGRAAEKRDRVQELLDGVEAEPGLFCPSCQAFAGERIKQVLTRHNKPGARTADLKKKDFGIESKHVFMYLLIHPKWLEGTPGKDEDGNDYGGYAGADPEASARWWRKRLEGLSLVEVRGRVRLADDESMTVAETVEPDADEAVEDVETEESLDDAEAEPDDRKHYGPPARITLQDGTVSETRTGTVPGKSKFRCEVDGIGQDILESVKQTGRTAPVAPYALQCHCPTCERDGFNYNGRYFKEPDASDIGKLNQTEQEWLTRKESDLNGYWPRSPLWPSYMTHKLNGGIPNWGYTHWSTMFNPRQLLVHTQLLRAIDNRFDQGESLDVAEQALGGFQQYLRNQNMFCFWDMGYDKLVPMMSNANYHPKSLIIENCVFHKLGRGNWTSIREIVAEGLEWAEKPWECSVQTSEAGSTKRSAKVLAEDRVGESSTSVLCKSSTDLSDVEGASYSLAITDPPFGNNLFYGDLADFFYVWMRLALRRWYLGKPEQSYFEPERTPRAIEAVQNDVEHPDDREEWEAKPHITADVLSTIRRQTGDASLQVGDANPHFRKLPASQFYCDTLTACWRETARLLKPGGLMAFTFHHSADAPWVDVLEALFNAGFVLEATYPIRSDETKGTTGTFGSRKIEYDIIHVCRKRLEEPQPVSWAKMRRWVKDESARYKVLLEHVHGTDLTQADLLVILRGKALEFYSRHYGQVLTGDRQILGVRDALLGINQLLEDLLSDTSSGRPRPPDVIEPTSRLFLGLFQDRDEMTRDELSKTLRGTGVDPNDLQAMGWVRIVGTRIFVKPIGERFNEFRIPGRTRKAALKSDLDQAHFLIGIALGGSGLSIPTELDNGSFVLKKSVDAILGWYAQTAREESIRDAAAMAARLVDAWRKKPKPKPTEAQLSLFSELDEEGDS